MLTLNTRMSLTFTRYSVQGLCGAYFLAVINHRTPDFEYQPVRCYRYHDATWWYKVTGTEPDCIECLATISEEGAEGVTTQVRDPHVFRGY